MSENAKKQFVAVPLPSTPAEWVRKTEFNRTNNDRVEDLHLKLLNDPKKYDAYTGYLRAVDDANACEGALSIDNAKAAEMIRDLAIATNEHVIAGLKLKTITIALNIVMKRYGVSRKQRRQTIGGQIIDDSNGND